MPNIDRGLTDARNVLAVVMEIKHDKCRLGTEQGVLHGCYSFRQPFKAPRTSILLIKNGTENGTRSLRELVKLQSVTDGQGLLRYSCKKACATNKCKCKQAKVLYNSRCHQSSSCNNK